jgi:hypothetical protein
MLSCKNSNVGAPQSYSAWNLPPMVIANCMNLCFVICNALTMELH